MAYNLVVSLLLVAAVSCCFALSSGSSGGSSSSNSTDETCLAPLETLFSCLSYAQGKEALPSTTCCTNMDKVFRTQKKCLCDLIAASFQGGIAGLPPFNRTIALHMPSACNIPADPSKCPGLLGIPASSPEAKQFTDAALKPNGTSVPSATTTSSTSMTNPTSSSTTLSINNSSASIPFITLAFKSLLLLLCYIQL